MQGRFDIALVARCTLLIVAVLFAACAPAPPRPVVEDRAPGSAQQAYDEGAYRKAARLWQQNAIDAPPEAASRLRLRAADAWLLSGDMGAAGDLLPWIEENVLSAPDTALLNLVKAELAVEDNRPVEARRNLDRIGRALPDTYSARYATLSRRIESAVGSISAQSVQRAGEMARDMRGYDAEAAVALMRQLERVASGQLADLSVLDGDPNRAAWFDLALVLRGNLVSGQQLERAIQDWKNRHPDHTVSAGDALDLWLRYRQDFRPPARVAVLLPESGRLKAAGMAIRDGIMSAYLARPSASKIRFYGTGDETESVLAAYFEAADDGAEWIIGPLAKASVYALLNLAGLSTPVLALNDLPDRGDLPAGLAQQVFGMSLSQEREAAAIARQMAELGYEKAVLLAPENAWGERIAQAFQADFLQQEGEILVSARYLPEENDHSEMLERVLRIDESKARKQRLENRLQIELEFEPVRRKDVDAIFLAAEPEQGRLLAPQLRFFEAGDIPTFTTSRIYTGKPDPARNQDLDGVYLPLIAWQLEHSAPESIPDLASLREGQFAPLYAIGMDAWNILPWLDLLSSDPDFRFPGHSGLYSVTEGGNLHRDPAWGRFRSGVPVAAAVPPHAPHRLSAAR